MSGVIHYELFKSGEAITVNIYCQQLKRLKEKFKEKRSALINRKRIIFYHNNARPHTASIIREQFRKLNWEILSYYSSHLAPIDYLFFKSLEYNIYGQKFQNLGEVQNHVNNIFNSIHVRFCKSEF